MPTKSKRKWMQRATSEKTRGSFSRSAKRAHMSTQAYARKEQHAPGKLGKRARLALVYAKFRPTKRKTKRKTRRTEHRRA